MKRLSVLLVALSFPLLGLGVLFLLATGAEPSYWLLALMFIGGGAGLFWFSANLMKKARLMKEDASEWLPVDDILQAPYAWSVPVTIVLFIAAVLFELTTGRGTVLLCVVTTATIVALAVNAKHLISITRDNMIVSQMYPEHRVIARQAYAARRISRNIVYGFPKNRRRFWMRYVEDTEKIVQMVLSIASRADDFRVAGAGKAWDQKLNQAKIALDKMVSTLASATSAAELETIDGDMAEATEALALLNDQAKGFKEVSRGA